MNVDIQDLSTFKSVSFNDLLSYLTFSGWKSAVTEPGFRSVLRRLFHEQEAEVVVPLDESLVDYPEGIGRAIKLVAEVEGRSQLEILANVQAVGSDVIRVRAVHESFADGTVPLDAGTVLVESARALLLAAALAADSPRAAYGSRRSIVVENFLKEARLGQTEQGSYVITMRTRIPPDLLQNSEQPRLDFVDVPAPRSEPFERRVTETLFRALRAVKEASTVSSMTHSVKPFIDAVATGVSSNLLDAVISMTEVAGAEEANVSVGWSPARAPSPDVVSEVRFQRSETPTLKEASRILRERTPNPDFALEGMVIGLEAEDQSAPHIITVRARVGGHWRKVRIELNEADYQLAIKAHQDWAVVLCEGLLVKDGRQYVLRQPRHFEIYSEEPPLPFSDAKQSQIGIDLGL